MHSPQSPLRVTNVGYMNSVPYRMLRSVPWISYHEDVPALAATALHEGECDLALIPVAELIGSCGYDFLPFGIAANGPVFSVMLFSSVPIQQIERILLDTSSQTAAALTRVLFDRFLGQPVTFERAEPSSIPDRIEGSTAGLLIGDRVLTLQHHFPHTIDLSESWHGYTGLPFVFAVWAYRPGSLHASEIGQLCHLMEDGIDKSEVFAREYAEEIGVERDLAVQYVSNVICYQITSPMVRGLEHFHDLGEECGLFPARTGPLSRQTTGGLQRRAPEAVLLGDGRLSLSDAVLLAAECPLAELALAAHMRRRGEETASRILQVTYAFEGALGTKESIVDGLRSARANTFPIVSLQGGAEITLEFIEEILRVIRPQIAGAIAALSADEVLALSLREKSDAEEVLTRLALAGLNILGGRCSRLLLSRYRSNSSDWYRVHRIANRLGLRSQCGIELNVGETWEDRLLHLYKLRQFQDETGAFFGLHCCVGDTCARGKNAATEYLRMISIARLFLDNISVITGGTEVVGTPIGEISRHCGADEYAILG